MKTHFLQPLLREPGRTWTLVVDGSPLPLATAVRTAFDSRSRREGLLRQADWPAGSALIIAPCQAVHSVGMQFPIDVVFVDRRGSVVKVRERLRPWRVAGAWRAFATIELPAGTVAGAVRRGDVIAVRTADA